jgi:methyl acetate hydrolase
MDNTSFVLTAEQTATRAAVHVKDRRGNWLDAGNIVRRIDPGGHGLYSTPRHYARFERALLRDGELDGARILTGKIVDEAFRNQSGGLDFPAEIPTVDPASSGPLNLGPGYKWGYGLLLNTADLPVITPEALQLYLDYETALYAAL